MSKKNRKNKKYQGPKLPKRPEKFSNFEECVKWLKKSVYIIVRGRKIKVDNQDQIKWITLGTGFIAAPYRFITAAHVINDPIHKNEETLQHQEGDQYLLLKHDDEGSFYGRFITPKMDKELFTYSDIDLAIMYLDEAFYQNKDKVLVEKNDFIRISKDFYPIGAQIGVLGYPLCKLTFKDHRLDQPNIGGILLRADCGVINCRYQTSEKHYIYEFTLAFNPGNSGGPIFDIKTGRIISIVRGYKAIPINKWEIELTEAEKKSFVKYKNDVFVNMLSTVYSEGFATPTFLEIFKKHNIL